MKKYKLLLPLLLVAGLAGLSGCALFDDADMAFSNSYILPTSSETSIPNDAIVINGVVGERISKVSNALCFKNINYAKDNKIINTYKEGGVNHTIYNVNSGKDYEADEYSNTYDLYIPDSVKKNEKHKVILFVHGGAWVSGFKTDVNPYIYEFANRGYITATIKYTLLNKKMDNPSLSIFRDLDEIDACIDHIKSSLGKIGFDTTKSELVIGGASSGSHLSMLYSYSRGDKSPIPLSFVIDAVGPVDIKPASWKAFKNASDEVLTAGITASAIEAQELDSNISELKIAGDTSNWNDYQTMRIANGMCGLPFSLEDIESTTDESKAEIVHPNAASNSILSSGGGEDLLSVTYWLPSSEKYPIICAYAGKDDIVGIGQYARLEKCLTSVEHEFFYFQNSGHTNISKDETTYASFINKIVEWCATK